MLFILVRFKVHILQTHYKISILAYFLYISSVTWLYLSGYTIYWKYFLEDHEVIETEDVNNFFTVRLASDLWFSIFLTTFIQNDIKKLTRKNGFILLVTCFILFIIFGWIIFGEKAPEDPIEITEEMPIEETDNLEDL